MEHIKDFRLDLLADVPGSVVRIPVVPCIDVQPPRRIHLATIACGHPRGRLVADLHVPEELHLQLSGLSCDSLVQALARHVIEEFVGVI